MAYGQVNANGSTEVELKAIRQVAENANKNAAAAQKDAAAALDAITKVVNKIDVVPSQNGSLTYNGSNQSPVWNNYNPDVLTIGGVTQATNAGTYKATFTPKETYAWADGTEGAKEVTWTIGKATVSQPVQSGNLTYNGSSQNPTWSGYDAAKMSIGGTTSGTNAGTYKAKFTPLANYQWGDGSTAAKESSWTIGKAAGSLSLDKTSLGLTAASKSQTFTVTRLGDGAITATSSNTAVATTSVNGNVVTVTGLKDGSATITVKVAAGTNHTAPANKTVPVSVAMSDVFGVMWSKGSSTALTRLTTSNDPNNLVTVNISGNPSPAVGTGAGSSPFDSYAPWKDMDEYNIVNNAVGARKGTSGFSRTANDVMVYIPEFWFKIVESGGKRYFYISNAAKSGFTKHPGSGKYVGRYNTGNSSGYVSRSGLAPQVSMTRATARTQSKAKGSKWSQYDFATWNAVWLLYLVEFADWNSQAKIGRGYVDGNSSAIKSGGTDSMAYHTGRAAGTDGKTAVQYRHIENPWGNVWEWIDGVNFSERKAYICTNPANYADDTASNYTDAGVTLPSSGWIKDLGLSSGFPWAFLPNTVGGSETTYIPDYLYSSTGWRVLDVGGYGNGASRAGLFYFHANNDSSSASTGIGARLLYHP